MAVVSSLSALLVPTCTKIKPPLLGPTVFHSLCVNLYFCPWRANHHVAPPPLCLALQQSSWLSNPPQTPSLSSSFPLSPPQSSSCVRSPYRTAICHLPSCLLAKLRSRSSPPPPRRLPSRLLRFRLLSSRLLRSHRLPSHFIPRRLLPSSLLPSCLLQSCLLQSCLLQSYLLPLPPSALPPSVEQGMNKIINHSIDSRVNMLFLRNLQNRSTQKYNVDYSYLQFTYLLKSHHMSSNYSAPRMEYS